MTLSVRAACLFATVFAVTAALGVIAGGATDNSGQATPVKIVAAVGSHKIASDQLEELKPSDEILAARARLLNARESYYQAQRGALNKLIDEQLLEQEAAKEHVTVAELVQRHVKSKVKNPSDETLRIYWMGTERPESYDGVREKIRAYILAMQEKKILAGYLESLRSSQAVVVMLEPPRLDVALGDSPADGPQNALVTFIEFADYQCPYCRTVEPNLERVREEFKGKLRSSFRDFPLPMHPYAEKAAEAARCAGSQGKFWPFHDRLFAVDPKDGLAVPQLKVLARDAKLDGPSFDKCLDSGEEAAAVQKDLQAGKDLGLSGTPSFIINGYYMSGALSYDMLHEFIQQQLSISSGHAQSAAAAGPSCPTSDAGKQPRLAGAAQCDPSQAAKSAPRG
jgi:protein-disulfide isomerase